MDTRTLIASTIDAEIETIFNGKTEVISFLKNHERKNLLIDNLCKEIRIAELRPMINFEKKTLIDLAKSFTKSFAQAALAYQEQQINDELFRQRVHENRKQEKYEEEMNMPIEEWSEGAIETLRKENGKV